MLDNLAAPAAPGSCRKILLGCSACEAARRYLPSLLPEGLQVFRVKRRSTRAEPEEYNQVFNEHGPRQVCICGNSLRKMVQNTVFTQRHLYARGEQGNAENISGINTYVCVLICPSEKSYSQSVFVCLFKFILS